MSQEQLKFCTVCASNNNRSMEAHKVLKEHGFIVRSYGTGSAVRLPGVNFNEPNVFPFGTPYTSILERLNQQDEKVHTRNGVLDMTHRNIKVKTAPERWPYYNQPHQILPAEEHPEFKDELDFQVVITCEERCFDAVVDDFLNRSYFKPSPTSTATHCFNVEIRDDHESARAGGGAILDLANWLKDAYTDSQNNLDSDPFEDRIPSITARWQEKYPNFPLLYSLCFH
ncbi:unnamed protein product [Ambrosiozyma monospora]|uniref:Unnamed protein product n=1 Tax=Ambrosiozyma monospora TaxID=43982 RepID=A0ACB5T6K4_AMBMO|nr:unnamed protein product [Ambrosiozyma monospora]